MRLFNMRVPIVKVGFNPRICKRCDRSAKTTLKYDTVSIHASVKDATFSISRRFCPLCFNPRICKRCDWRMPPAHCRPYRFNPRICKRCDILFPEYFNAPLVSIHASVKDATDTIVFPLPSTNVSIHASVKDATNGAIANVFGCESFNPRICKRCDSILLTLAYMVTFQSTHL